MCFGATFFELFGQLTSLYLAACDATGYMFILCSIKQFPMRTIQCWAAFNMHYSVYHIAYIVFVLFFDHIYQNCIALQHV